MKKFINPLLSLGTAAALLGTIYFQNQEIDSLKKQTPIQPVVGSNNQNIVDSLQEELFMIQTQNGRNELRKEHKNEEKPKEGKEINKFI